MTHKGKTDQKQETQQKQTKKPSNYSVFLLNTVIPKMVVVVFFCLTCCHIFCFVFLNVLFVVVVFVFFFEVLRLRAINGQK